MINITERPIDPERKQSLRGRLVANFEWLFPELMKETADGIRLSPEEIVREHQHWLEAHRSDLFPNGATTEAALWDLFSMQAKDYAHFVVFGTALLWGELYGASDFDPQNFLKSLKQLKQKAG